MDKDGELFYIVGYNGAGYWACAVEYGEFKKILGIPEVGVLAGIEKCRLLRKRCEVLYEGLAPAG